MNSSIINNTYVPIVLFIIFAQIIGHNAVVTEISNSQSK